MQRIPYARPSITDADREAVAAAMGQWLTQGPLIEQFEQAVCDYTGARYCVALNSGTAALYLAAEYFLDDGEEAGIPAICFVALAHAILRTGCTYSVADLLTPDCLIPSTDEPISIGVDIGGEQNAWGTVIDSAHSFDRDMSWGPEESCRCRTLSFHAQKNITTLGEGGAIITNEQGLAEWAREMRTHGHKAGLVGHNFRMTCAQAAMGLSQLERADAMKARKQTLVERYRDELPKELVRVQRAEQAFWHLFIVRFQDNDVRECVRQHLSEHGIETQVHYRPVNQWPHLPKGGLTPNAAAYYETALSLPLFADMTDGEQTMVIEHIEEAMDD